MPHPRSNSKSKGRKKLLVATPLEEVREKKLLVAKPLSDTEIRQLEQGAEDTAIHRRSTPPHEAQSPQEEPTPPEQQSQAELTSQEELSPAEEPATKKEFTRFDAEVTALMASADPPEEEQAEDLPVIDTSVPSHRKQKSFATLLATAMVPYFTLPSSASMASSFVVHALIFAGCLLLYIQDNKPPQEEVVIEPEVEEVEELFFLDQVVETREFIEGIDVEMPDTVELTQDHAVDVDFNDIDAGNSAAASTMPPVADMENELASLLKDGLGRTADPWSMADPGLGIEDDGLNAGVRYELRRGAEGRGATKESEKAVELALQWLAKQQLQDGSWSFGHTNAGASGPDQHGGSAARARNAATGMALLPFLGAGHTHLQGKHQETVARGLAFLLANMKRKQNIGSFHEPEGRMYSHGIATLALCEAYAMSLSVPKPPLGYQEPDRETKELIAIATAKLGTAAQLGINGIAYAQAPGGGWRYEPKQAGDMSVVGWQLMALKSGILSGLYVEPTTIAGVNHFLDRVQRDSGADYGYVNDQQGSSATRAIGLLSRMYLGWKPGHAPLERGVKELGRIGPSRNNLYYSYYATQVMYHHGGDAWNLWNPKMRDSLVASQVANGEYAGSWVAADPHGAKQGGRLYSTAMSAMTLEVYYRYLPLYGQAAIEE